MKLLRCHISITVGEGSSPGMNENEEAWPIVPLFREI